MSRKQRHVSCSCSRRDFLARGLYGIGVGAGLPLILGRTSAALAAQALEGTSVEKHPERILVAIELSGGNDGLNTVVPYGDAAYYRARPKLGIPEREVRRATDGFGFHPSMVGFERLYKDGHLAVVHGCGYDHPSLSHFSSMGFWHTGVPNGGEPLGWLGRLADHTYAPSSRNMIVNVGSQQSLAVRSQKHSPLVFQDPSRFRRDGTDAEKQALAALSHPGIHASRDTMAKSLEGTWRADVLFILQQEVTMYDAYLHQIEECDQALQQHLKVFTDKLVDLSARRMSEGDMQKWGYRVIHLIQKLAANPGEHRAEIVSVLAGKPTDLPSAGDVYGAETQWVEEHDPRIVHFGEYQLAVCQVPRNLDPGEVGRRVRLRTGARLSLAAREGDDLVVLASNDEKRPLNVMSLLDAVGDELSFVRPKTGGDRVGRARVAELDRRPERIEELIGGIVRHRSILYG